MRICLTQSSIAKLLWYCTRVVVIESTKYAVFVWLQEHGLKFFELSFKTHLSTENTAGAACRKNTKSGISNL